MPKTQREHLLSYLEQASSYFPKEIKERGINRYWNDYRFVLKELASLLHPSSAQIGYLDLGTGSGVIPLVLALAGFDVTAVDTWDEYESRLDNQMGDRENIVARLKSVGINCVRHDILRSPLPFPSESFDMISVFAVLEHLPRPLAVLEEVKRVLRPGGLLLITVPNVANLRNRIRLLLGKSPHADDIETWISPTFFGHFREMTMPEVIFILKRLGLSVIRSKRTSACHWNTRCSDGHWESGYRFNSVQQCVKFLYLAVAQTFPGFRYEIFAVGKKDSVREFERVNPRIDTQHASVAQ